MLQHEMGDVTMAPTKEIHPDPTNLKVHSESNLRYIEASIEKFGFADPIGVVANPDTDEGGYMVVEGHGRLEAAQRLKLKKVPIVVLELDEASRRGYAIAHNQIQQITGMDMGAVASEFHRLGITTEDHQSLGFSEEDVLFMPGINGDFQGDKFSGPNGEYQEQDGDGGGDIGVRGGGAFKEFVPVVHKSTLRFASDTSYNRFLELLSIARDKHPMAASMGERMLCILKDAGYNGEPSGAAAE